MHPRSSTLQPKCGPRGEICASLMGKKSRVINGRINYVKGIQRNRNELLESILWIIQTEQETKWIKRARKYMTDVNISFNHIHQKSKEYLKQFMIKLDLNIWKAELEMKTILQIYEKKNIADEEIYDNRPSSNILNKAKTNTLQLNDRNRHTYKEINCMVCDKDEKEDIYHFMLHCTAYNEERSHSTQLQQPYIESDYDILGHFLFNKEDIEEMKELLFSIWKRGQLQMKII